MCDGHSYCDDQSDEKYCPRIVFEKNHNKNFPPKTKGWDISDVTPTVVETKISILNVMTVDQEEHQLDLIAKIEFNWLDPRLSYPFLKNNSYENDINKTTSDQIWIPNYELLFLEDFTQIIYKLIIVKNGVPTMLGGSEALHPLETYDGAENSLHMEITFRGKFLCHFANMGNYPFAHDNCNFTIYLIENRVASLKLVKLGQSCKPRR